MRKAPPPPRFTRQPPKEKMFLALLIFARLIFSKMERTFFFLGFCPPSIRAVWRGFNADSGFGKIFFWGFGFCQNQTKFFLGVFFVTKTRIFFFFIFAPQEKGGGGSEGGGASRVFLAEYSKNFIQK